MSVEAGQEKSKILETTKKTLVGAGIIVAAYLLASSACLNLGAYMMTGVS